MVNVDEMNESIKKFSQVIEGLNRLDDTYSQIRETRERLEQGIDKVREVSAKQNEMVSEVKLKLHDMQMDTNRKIDGMQENMRDKLSLVETSIKNCVVDSQKELAEDMKNQLDELKTQVEMGAKKAKTERIILMVGVGLSLALLVAHFFV